jgi:hypothetical protein
MALFALIPAQAAIQTDGPVSGEKRRAPACARASGDS